ncbi:OmpA family protein [Daejeonella sp.]|jgi:outer membrane protein OmpA-like peptidoglycan-associated protein|uniref:OmpA family protein n=1 Tax=Daejeonella sp. TaxID=2805397 RepID=UPI0037C0D054
MDKSVKYVAGNFVGNFFTHQKSPFSIGEKIPDGELHNVHLYKGSLTEAVLVDSFEPEKHLNRAGMLLHNVTNIEINSNQAIENAIYDFDQLVLKNVKVDYSWEQNGKTYGILKGELVGKIKKQSKLPLSQNDGEVIPPPPVGGGAISTTPPIGGDNSSWNRYVPPIITDGSRNGGCLSSIWSILKWLLLLLLILFLLKQCQSTTDNNNQEVNYACISKVDSLEELTKNQQVQIDSLTNLIFYADSICNSNLERERLQYELDNLSSEIYFYGNDTKIREYSNDDIDNIVKILKENPNVSIEIHGYHNGSQYTTIDQDRANRIKEIFIAKGVSENLIKAIGKGQSENCPENVYEGREIDEKGWNCNMRVEIKIVKY